MWAETNNLAGRGKTLSKTICPNNEIVPEQDEGSFEGQVDVVEYDKTQTKVWKGPRPS
jgi:hypothetical protein